MNGISRLAVIRMHACPRQCGWRRTYQLNQWWLDQVIVHPIYGKIRMEDLVQAEIADHACEEYVAAHNRAVKRKRDKCQ